MLFEIDAQRQEGGWHVSYSAAQAPLTDAAGQPLVRELAAWSAETEALLAAFGDKQPARAHDNGMVVLGRHLFDALIGADAWQAIREKAGAEPIELGLSWDGAPELSALPWEAMHDGALFLAQQPKVSILRRVPGAAAPPTDPGIASPAKVLIVVGSDPADRTIQAGIEYARLLQSLRAAQLDLSLRTFLLLDATAPRIETALKEIAPDVVHFICHGEVDEHGKAYVEIRSEENRNLPFAVYAAPLLTMLAAARPRIVVLTACNSAKAAYEGIGQVATPLAEELVRGGIPLVVGMAGRIGDQACRLFTRKFYEALLQGSDVARATADGRRAAFAGAGFDPVRTVDWALPALFLSSGLPGAAFPVALQQQDQEWHKRTIDFEVVSPPFCDRSHHMAKLDLLTAPDAVQRKWLRNAVQGLILTCPRPGEGKYGSTRVVQELAARAARSGHIVVLAQPVRDKRGRPKTPEDLPRLFGNALKASLIAFFDLKCPQCRQPLDKAAACAECAVVRALLADPPLPGETTEQQAAGVLEALRMLLAWGRRFRGAGESMKLVLLIEDLHELGPEALDALIERYVSQSFRIARDDFRLVLSYAEGTKRVTDWLETAAWIDNDRMLTVGKLTGVEEETAYETFLRTFSLPVTIHATQHDNVMKTLREKLVRGIPSNFKEESRAIEGVIEFLRNAKLAFDADDDAALRALAGGPGGGP